MGGLDLGKSRGEPLGASCAQPVFTARRRLRRPLTRAQACNLGRRLKVRRRLRLRSSHDAVGAVRHDSRPREGPAGAGRFVGARGGFHNQLLLIRIEGGIDVGVRKSIPYSFNQLNSDVSFLWLPAAHFSRLHLVQDTKPCS